MKAFEVSMTEEEINKKIKKKFESCNINLDMANPTHIRLWQKFKNQIINENKEEVKNE